MTQAARTASGGYASIVGAPSADEPALDRRELASLERRQDQLGHQPHASVPFGACQQVFDGRRRRPVGLVPVGGAQVQFGDDVGLDATKLTEQELSEQAVVAVPLPSPVEGDQEQVRRLQLPKPFLRAWFSDHGLA